MAEEWYWETTDDLSEVDVATIDNGLDQFNNESAPLDQVRRLCVVVRNSGGNTIGGLLGRTWNRCFEIQVVWVEAEHRRQGLASRLFRNAEARRRGCQTAFLETFSFQAPPLYESLGYESKLELDGFPNGICKFIFVKQIDARTQKLSASR